MSIEPAPESDALLNQARALLLTQQNPSIAFLQRALKIGHRRAVSWRRIQAEFKKRNLPVELIFEAERSLSFHSQGKTVMILIQDNNETLDFLRRAGVQIHHFFGVCDGCCEGGNHECVHERPFLSRLLPLAANGMVYTTDHSRPL